MTPAATVGAPMTPELAAAIATLEAAGIDTPEKFADLIAEPEPEPDPPDDDPDEVIYARGVVEAALRRLADGAGIELGPGHTQVDALGWSDTLVHRLIDHGLDVPTDWADRTTADALHATFPPGKGVDYD